MKSIVPKSSVCSGFKLCDIRGSKSSVCSGFKNSVQSVVPGAVSVVVPKSVTSVVPKSSACSGFKISAICGSRSSVCSGSKKSVTSVVPEDKMPSGRDHQAIREHSASIVLP